MNFLPSEENAKADVESGQYERVRPIKPGDIVLDLGANVGYFTERAARAVEDGWVIAFEPDKPNFERLLDRTAGFPNVITVRAGAMNVGGKAILYHNPGNCGAHSYFMNSQHNGCLHTPIVHIGKWLRLLGLTPTFVKIDTEGCEALLISNLLFWGIQPFFTYETHNAELYWDCRRTLEHHGYAVTPEMETVGICWATLK